MTEGFSHIYSQKDVEEIEQKRSPATALLIDLDGRGESLENLIGALEKIGNKRAISIITENGRSPNFNTGQMRDGRIYKDFDGCPPHINIREPVEHAMNDVPSNVEQAGTLIFPPYPIQESRGNGWHPDELESCELLIKFLLLCLCQ